MLAPVCVLAQPALDNRDKMQITYLAKQKVLDLEQLYNALSNTLMYEAEIKVLVENSLSQASNNRIFYNEKSIVESDLDPNYVQGTRPKPADEEVGRYLSNFDLHYTKSNNKSVQLSDLKVSKVYEDREFPYVLVFFTRNFANPHKRNNKSFAPMRRVALIRAERLGSQWDVFVASLAYADPNSAIEEETYDLKLPEGFENISDTTSLTEVQLRVLEEWKRNQETQERLMEELRKEFERDREREAAERTKFAARLIEQGDLAFAEGDYENALAAYREASTKDPYSTEAFQKIRAVNDKIKAEEARLIEAEARFQKIIKDGSFAYRIRNYEEAEKYYAQAHALKPQVDSVDERLRRIQQININLKELSANYRMGNYDEAIKDFTRGLKDDPTNADLLVLRGLSYEQVNKASKAEEDYTAALAAYADYHQAYARRGFIREMSGQLIPAEADYSRALSLRRVDPDMYAQRARLRIRLGNTQGALEDYSEAILQRPTDGLLYYQRGQLHNTLGMRAQAFDDFTSAVELDEKLADAWFERGMLSVRAQEYVGAGKDFMQAKAHNLDPARWQQVVALADRHYQEGQRALQQRDYEAAATALDLAVTLRPDLAEGWFALGETYAAGGDRYTAIENFSEAMRQRETYYQAMLRRGEMQAEMAQYRAAIADFDAALQVNEVLIPALLAKGRSLTALEQLPEALAPYQRAIQIDPKLAVAHHEAGLLQLRLRNFTGSVASFSAALKYDKVNAMSYYYRGLAQAGAQQYSSAIKDYTAALKYKTIFPEAHFARAEAYRLAGKGKNALPDYDAAIRMESAQTALAYFQKGHVHLALKQPGPAATAWEQAIALQDSLATPQLFLATGMASLDALAWKKAETWFLRTLEADSSSAEAVYGLACAYTGFNRYGDALEQLRVAMASGKYSGAALWADKRLKALRKDPSFKQLVNP
ncbi:MAG: hypothetical protein OHK0039_13940 [Bacteroidia bacterium]